MFDLIKHLDTAEPRFGCVRLGCHHRSVRALGDSDVLAGAAVAWCLLITARAR